MISLGSINFGITADVQSLQRAVTQLQQFGAAVSRTAASQAQGAQQVAKDLMAQERAGVRAIEVAKRLTDQLRAAGAPQTSINNVTTSFNALIRSLTSGQLSALEFQRAQERFNAGANNVSRTVRQLNADNRESERITRAAAVALGQYERAAIGVDKTLATARDQVTRFNAAAAGRRDPSGRGGVTNQTSRVAGAFQNLQGVLGDPTTSARQAAEAQTQFRRALTESQVALRSYATVAATAGGHTDAFGAALHRIGQVTVLTTGPLGGFSTRIQVLARFFSSMPTALAATVGGIGLAIAAFVKLSEAVIRTERALDTETRVLTAINGNHVLTEIQMRKLMETADQTGTKFEELIGPFTKWMQTTKGTGIEGEKANLIFQQMATVAGVMHMPIERFSGAMDNMRRMIATNTVTLRELHQRLETELPGSSHIAAEALGVTIDKLDSLQKVGMSSQVFIQKFMAAYVNSLGGIGQRVEGVTAAEARFHNSLIKLWDSIDKQNGISIRYIATLERMASVVGNISRSTDSWGTLWEIFWKRVIGPDVAAASRKLKELADSLDKKDPGAGDTARGLADALNDTVRLSGKAKEAVTTWQGALQGVQASAEGTKSAVAGATPELNKFIDAFKSSTFGPPRDETQRYIDDISKRIVATEELVKSLEDAQKASSQDTHHYLTDDQANEAAAQNTDRVRRLLKEKLTLGELRKAYDDLQNIARKPLGPAKEDDIAQPDFTKQIRLYDDEVKKLTGDIENMGQGESVYQKYKTEIEAVNTELAKWREHLTDTHTGKEISDMTQRMEKLGDVIRQRQLYLRQFKEVETPAQFLMSAFDQMTSSAGRFADALVEGTLNMKTMGDIAKGILKQLIADFIKLALLAPLKNALFGSNDRTFGLTSGGGAGVGGWLGRTIGTIMNPGAGFAIPAGARGMAVTPGGFRYAGGGIFDTPTMFGSQRGPILGAEAGPEGILPLTRTQGGKLGVIAKFPFSGAGSEPMPTAPPTNVHFHGAPAGTRVEESTDANGGKRLDAFFSDMMAKAAQTSGSSFQQGVKSTYGLAPATVRRGAA